MFLDPQTVLSVVLGVVVALLLTILIVQKVLRVDSVVDERQETYSKLAALFERAEMKKLADIGHKLAALSIRKAFRAIKALVDSLEGDEELLIALDANYLWQTGKRLDRPQDRAKLLRAVTNHPEAKVELRKLLDVTTTSGVTVAA